MRRDKISPADVEDCLDSPQAITDTVKQRKNYWKRFGAGYLRVTIANEGSRLVVVSAVVKERMNLG
jgi:hypothetical protein